MLPSILRTASRLLPNGGSSIVTPVLSTSRFARFSAAALESKAALSIDEYRSFTVTKVESLTHDTKRLLLALPKDHVDHVDIPVASCLMIKADINGEEVCRAYTPTDLNADNGELELVVKGYSNGKLSKHIVNLQQGDSLDMQGPYVKFPYKANQYKTVGFLCGGSGIAPALQVIKEACFNPQDFTEMVVVFANKTEKDIILRDYLDELQRSCPQLHLHYVLDQPSADWQSHSGYISKELIQKLLPPPSDDNLICVCGSPQMMESISGDVGAFPDQGELKGMLKELGFSSQQVYKF